MKRSRFKIWIAGIIAALSLAVLTGTAVRAFYYAPETEVALSRSIEVSHLEKIDDLSAPVRLRIPRLGIKAAVQYVGVNEKGNMAAPTNFADVGWYKYGPLPGQSGAAVIDGHVNNGLGLPGVFERLNELAVGDEVVVETKDGRGINFSVKEKKIYPYGEVPLELVFDKAGAAKLNLITCVGDFLSRDRTYDQRLVVFTELNEPVSEWPGEAEASGR